MSFWYLLVLYSVLIDLSRQISQPILVAIFVTIAMVKVELIRDFLHFDYFTNKPMRTN